MTEEEGQRLRSLEDTLKKRVIGPDAAAAAPPPTAAVTTTRGGEVGQAL